MRLLHKCKRCVVFMLLLLFVTVGWVGSAYRADLPEEVLIYATAKEKFVAEIAPLVVAVNQELLHYRKRLLRIEDKLVSGDTLSLSDLQYIDNLRITYGLDSNKELVDRQLLEELLRRIDILPLELVLAQSALESAWGKARFVREGNALFGQWTTTKYAGIKPLRADKDSKYLIRAFRTRYDSVKSYYMNLSTHRAYRKLRKRRYELRRGVEGRGNKDGGGDLCFKEGKELATYLASYSEKGEEYIKIIHTLMNNMVNDPRIRNHLEAANRSFSECVYES